MTKAYVVKFLVDVIGALKLTKLTQKDMQYKQVILSTDAQTVQRTWSYDIHGFLKGVVKFSDRDIEEAKKSLARGMGYDE